MNILALDLGTKTGWATLQRKTILSGVQVSKPGRFEGGGMRYLHFAQWLNLFIATGNQIDYVVFEEVRRHLGVDAAHAYGGFMATLTSWCENWKVPYQGVPVATIKKFWTGKGNAPKDIMIRMAQERGFKVEDDNEADALALLHWAMHERMNSQATETIWDGPQAPNLKRKVDEATSRARIGPALNVKPRHRVSLGLVPVARRRIGGGAG